MFDCMGEKKFTNWGPRRQNWDNRRSFMGDVVRALPPEMNPDWHTAHRELYLNGALLALSFGGRMQLIREKGRRGHFTFFIFFFLWHLATCQLWEKRIEDDNDNVDKEESR